MEQRLALTLNTHLTDAEMARIQAQIRRWWQHGGVAILPPGAQITAYPFSPDPTPDGVSEEMRSWADEQS